MEIVKKTFQIMLVPIIFLCSCSVENDYERLFKIKATKDVVYNYLNKHKDDSLFYLSRCPPIVLSGKALKSGFLLGPYPSGEERRLYKVVITDEEQKMCICNKTIYYNDLLYNDLCTLMSDNSDIPEKFFIGCFDGWIYLSEPDGECYVSNRPDTLFFPEVIEVQIKDN